MAGAAVDWLESLDAQAIRTTADIKTAFDGRYKTPDIVKLKSAREIFSRKQGQDETSDDYITQMTKLEKLIQADEKKNNALRHIEWPSLGNCYIRDSTEPNKHRPTSRGGQSCRTRNAFTINA